MKTVIGLVTCSNSTEAKKIAKHLLEKKLVACCNIVPEIESIYLWKGEVKQGSEALLIVKTREQLKEKVQEEIEKIHSYELPVIEFIETELSSKACKWIEKETKE
ncbi:MAG: divalent-cation tolerance protein CutA [archaeon]|jgi:periplasmic divalent cation tolerance protein|nr:divalent-cation tolerance protein CutA [archaeon]